MIKVVYKINKYLYSLVKITFILLIFLFCNTLKVIADSSAAISFYNEGKFKQSKNLCKKDSNVDDPVCLNLLGSIIIAQKDTDRYYEARIYFEKAWHKGYSNAAKNLALIYALGLGVEKDLIKSSSLYKQSEKDTKIEKDIVIDVISDSDNSKDKTTEEIKKGFLELQLRSSYASYLKINKISEIIDSENNNKKFVQSSELNHVEDSMKYIINFSMENGLDIKNILKEVKKDQELNLMLITNDFGLNNIDFRSDVVTNLKLINKIKNEINH